MTKTIEKIIISAAFLALVYGIGSGLELKALTDFMVAGVVAVASAPLLTAGSVNATPVFFSPQLRPPVVGGSFFAGRMILVGDSRMPHYN